MVGRQHPIRHIQDIPERLITEEMPEVLHQKGRQAYFAMELI